MILMLNTSLTNDAYVQHEHNIWYTAWLELLVVLKYNQSATDLQLLAATLELLVSSHATRSNYMRPTIRSIFVHTNGILS
jgi:hypothetical protein